MVSTVLLDSYDNVLVSPTFLKTWGPANGYNVLGMALYAWGSDAAMCGQGNPPRLTAAGRDWLEEATAVGMGCFLNLEIGASDPSNLGGPGGIVRANTVVACNKAAGAPEGALACLSNDSEVTNEANVIAFYSNADQIIRAAGYEPTGYMQSSVYETLLSYGIEWLWHAPDGTVGPPWPRGTVIAQRPSFFVSPQGYSCDVDDVIDVSGKLWNLNGIIGTPPTPIGKGRRYPMTITDITNGNIYLCLGKGKANCLHISPAEFAECQAAGLPHLSPSTSMFSWIYS